ncbi:S1 family peptidase [Nocardia donostiensis]|uniref:Peptidase S1 family protein n=1 Tax=Nocardia donostiensis TaxID=1538463 RepID=A0A1V2THP9_9NOCA|nr:S1 family peptidase [Nocardia donostiensis]ONM49049.1 peptidase S1 family protein [Nocardia donostiensis]OQS14066.1 peptidase S1 family protein [Nocardia donostiensis]OQS19529.1 peptidase S1 family protein [Nocardia donostiensis]
MFSKLAKAANAVFAVAMGAALLGTGAGAAEAAPGAPVIGGGSGIVIDDMFECTLTTVGHDAAGRLVGLTAGHCGDAGSQVYAEADRGYGPVGEFVYSNPRLDYAVIQFAPGRITPVNRVGNVTITGLGAPAQFPMIVCKEGRTTGNTCGISWGDVLDTKMETWAQMCVVEGDSGAPVVVGSTLVGMVNAYLAIACFGPEVGTNMSSIMDDLNARGSTGAGFRPI